MHTREQDTREEGGGAVGIHLLRKLLTNFDCDLAPAPAGAAGAAKSALSYLTRASMGVGWVPGAERQGAECEPP